MTKEDKICKVCNKEKECRVVIHKADDGDDWATIEYRECDCVVKTKEVKKNEWTDLNFDKK